MNEASSENKCKLGKAETASESEAVMEGKPCGSYRQALRLWLSLENTGVSSRECYVLVSGIAPCPDASALAVQSWTRR